MKRTPLSWIAFGLVCFIWGTTYMAIAVAIRTLPDFLFPALRFILGGLILLAICLAAGQKLPTRLKDWVNLTVIGFLMVVVGNVAVVFAERDVPSGMAALMVATAPFWMALLESRRIDGERMNLRKIVGTIVGFGGVAILVAPALTGVLSAGFLIGALVIQIGNFAWNLGAFRSKYESPRDVSPLVAASIQMLTGGMIAGVIGLGLGEWRRFSFTTETFLAFLYLVIFGSVVAYGAYVYALAHLPTSIVATHTYINPVIAVIAGRVLLDEPLGWRAVIAMLVIFAGVAIVRTDRSHVAQTATGILPPVRKSDWQREVEAPAEPESGHP
ncbi:MAG: EamA family transporter [Acidobacteria bacterium]|nr:EamA family transporter [Acidobacteriota bacterium]